MNNYFVYVLKCEDDNYYVGMTNNITHRLIAHLSGNGSRITRKYKPIDLYYVEEKESRDKAIQRETELTRIFRKGNIDLVLSKKYESLFKQVTNFITKYGNDCWYKLRKGLIEFRGNN